MLEVDRKNEMNMMSAKPVAVAFHEGDEVVLAEGTYQGTYGCLSPAEKGCQMGGYHRTQWKRPQAPGGMARSFGGAPRERWWLNTSWYRHQ